MQASATNVRRAGLLLRALAGAASWTADVFVNVRETAKARGIVATDAEIEEIETYLLRQGWIVADSAASGGEGRFAVTRHGLDESQRKLPPEPKAYVPREPTE